MTGLRNVLSPTNQYEEIRRGNVQYLYHFFYQNIVIRYSDVQPKIANAHQIVKSIDSN